MDTDKVVLHILWVVAVVNFVLAILYLTNPLSIYNFVLYIFHIIGTIICGAGAVYVKNELREESFEIPHFDFSRPQVTLVLAGTYSQYRQYLDTHGLTSRDARYIHRKEDIVGYHGPNINLIKVGTHWENPLNDTFELRTLEQEIKNGER